jgi:predicted DNA-binding transcriptional regulator AlpA
MAADTSPRRVRVKWVEERTTLDRSTISKKCKKGLFPAPHYLGRLRCWWQSEIEEWEAKQMARAAPQPVCQVAQ